MARQMQLHSSNEKTKLTRGKIMNHSDRKTMAGGITNKKMVWSGTVPSEIFRDRSGAALIFALLVMVALNVVVLYLSTNI